MVSVVDVRKIVSDKLRPYAASLSNMISRGTLTGLVEAGLQRAQLVLGDDEDTADDVECVTPFGLASRPASAEALCFSVGGDGSHRLALLYDRTTRLQDLQDGEVALHVGRDGQVVKLTADGAVEVKAKGSAASSIILKANGDIVIVPGSGATLYLGDEGATKKVALADEVDDRLSKLQTALDTHVHATAAPGAPSPPTPVPTIVPVGALAPTGATNVKAKG